MVCKLHSIVTDKEAENSQTTINKRWVTKYDSNCHWSII